MTQHSGLGTQHSALMLLAIDIGNSSTKFGVFDSENLVNQISIPTIRTNSADKIYELIKPEINGQISFVIISSVVTELEKSYRTLAEKLLNAKVLFVDNKFDSGLKINYFPPKTLGVDRLIAAFAAAAKYGKPIIVCDFGTATTIDAVNSKGEFLGGIIAPGMNILAETLFQKTSKLPKVEIKKPKSIFGNSTITSIQSGIYHGYAGLVDGILQKMIDELGENAKIIATGGLASKIAKSSELIEFIDEKLMLDGLKLISQNHLCLRG
ncbi:type III pantothenate kinase [soil metagenome]